MRQGKSTCKEMGCTAHCVLHAIGALVSKLMKMNRSMSLRALTARLILLRIIRMKLITLHQPYASLCALGLKRNETRHWATDYRGSLLIHAAKRKPSKALLEECCRHLNPQQKELIYIKATEDLGVIVSHSTLVDCYKMTPQNIALQSQLEKSVGYWEVGRFAFLLEDLKPLRIPFKSQQGKLLSVNPTIVEQVLLCLQGGGNN